MAELEIGFDLALTYMKAQHPQSFPNWGFRKQLQQYEAKLFGNKGQTYSELKNHPKLSN